MADPKLDRLKSTLQTTGLQQTNNALFQLLNDLIKYLREVQTSVSTIIKSGGGTSTTIIGQTGPMGPPGLIFGRKKESNKTIIISSSAASSSTDREWSVLTNGDIANPELIFSNGDVIMVHIP